MTIKIIVIDDTKHVREMLVSMLEIDGFDIVAAADTGVGAADLVEKHHPDIVIMDLSMPTVSGLQASREILAMDPNQRIVLYSAYLDPEVVDEANRIGVAMCVDKVQGLETLERRISELALGLRSD